jgi:hypothetical protein
MNDICHRDTEKSKSVVPTKNTKLNPKVNTVAKTVKKPFSELRDSVVNIMRFE